MWGPYGCCDVQRVFVVLVSVFFGWLATTREASEAGQVGGTLVTDDGLPSSRGPQPCTPTVATSSSTNAVSKCQIFFLSMPQWRATSASGERPVLQSSTPQNQCPRNSDDRVRRAGQ